MSEALFAAGAIGDRVSISGLRVQAIIGIHPWERKIAQPLLIDIAMAVDIRAAAESGDLTKSVDYSAVAEQVSEHIRASQFELIETLAESCARLVLEEFSVETLWFRVAKPEAVPAAESVSVEVVRRRDG